MERECECARWGSVRRVPHFSDLLNDERSEPGIRGAFRTVTGTYTIVLILGLAPSTESLFNAAKEH